MKKFGELSREEQLALFVAWLDGKTIEIYTLVDNDFTTIRHPTWNMESRYRVALTKLSINWDQLHPDYNWIATDKDGRSFAYTEEPYNSGYSWSHRSGSYSPELSVFASFKAGTCDWKDSLVQRPQKQGETNGDT